MFIRGVMPRLIKNSRGEKTIEVEVKTYSGKFVSSAPSGKSRGKFEVEQYNAKGIEFSLKLMKVLSLRLINKNFMIKNFDGLKLLDIVVRNFESKYGKIGGNCNYALQLAFLKAAAKENKKELWEFIGDNKKVKMPMPVGNCIEGGVHVSGMKKKPDFQEFLFIPKEKTFSRAVTKNVHAYERLKTELKKAEKKWKVKRGMEGGLETSLRNEDVLEIMKKVGKEFEVRIGIDVAASTFVDGRGYYNYKNKELIRDRQEQIEFIENLVNKFGIFYLEDPMEEEDFSGFKDLMWKFRKKNVLIVGDDLVVTNLQRLKRAVRTEAINAVIIKPNQVGCLLETKRVVDFCKENKIKMVFSHRGGETMDDGLGDLAVGWGADFLKAGVMGKERLMKLRRVMEIEKKILQRKN